MLSLMRANQAVSPLRMHSGRPGPQMSRRQWLRRLVISLVCCLPPAVCAEESAREQIGAVLGQPVYRDQLTATAGVALSNELHNLFSHPVMQQYRAAHRQTLRPTEREVSTAAAHFDGWHTERLKAQDHPLKGRRAEVEHALAKPGLTAAEKTTA